MHKILIIEDDLIDQMAFLRMLKKQDFDFVHTMVNSIQSATQELQEKTFDLVISDHNLPDGTAFDLLADLKKTPFILITGNEDNLMVESMVKNSNAVACFSKDINFDYLKKLPEAIHQVFNQKNSMTPILSHNEIKISPSIHEEGNVVVALSHALNIFDGKKSEVKEAIEIFIQYKPEEMNTLYNSINANDCQKAIETAHRIKSGFRLFGMRQQVELAEYIENNASADNKCQCHKITDAFKQLSSDTNVAIQILKKELPLL